MDKHREGKISLGEHGGNASHVLSNRFRARRVISLVRLHFNRTSIRQQKEMVMSHLMTEAHSFVAPLVDPIKVPGVSGSGRKLRLHRAGREQKDQANEEGNFHGVV